MENWNDFYYEDWNEKNFKIKYLNLMRSKFSVGEYGFEKSLLELHGKWNQLTTEEENTIIKIAKRFV